jgi:hypothetical protein
LIDWSVTGVGELSLVASPADRATGRPIALVRCAQIDFWNDTAEFFHRLWMGTLCWITPQDRQLLLSKPIHFHRNYVTDRDKQGGRVEFSPAALPTGLSRRQSN